jgi:hypothetical protein
MHVAFAIGGAEGIQFLRFAQCAKCCKGQHLSLAAGEQSRAMRTRRNTHLAPDRADVFWGAPIGALAHAEDALAMDCSAGQRLLIVVGDG